MKLEHYYISLLDVPDILPFTAARKENLGEAFAEQENADKKLWGFLSELEKDFGEELYFMGESVLGEKFYRRFMFDRNGFLEIMLERPCAIVAHFTAKERAEAFSGALKKALYATIPSDGIARLLVESLEVSCESAGSLTYGTWRKLKDLSGDIE